MTKPLIQNSGMVSCVIFSVSYACHSSFAAQVSVQAAWKRQG